MEPAAVWPVVRLLLEPVFRAGETYPHDPEITEAEAHGLWVEYSLAVVVVVDAAGAVVDSYYLRPNSFCLGTQIANAGCPTSSPLTAGQLHCRRTGGISIT
jgi:hypothetical protein